MKQKTMLLLTLLLCGRAMTIAFVVRAGGDHPGDPPAAWLMPLIGDAVIGVSGVLVAFLIVRRTGLWVWTTIVTWNVVAIWDAMSAFIIQQTTPWPEFFMIQLFGSSMFFMASAMHLVIIWLACTRSMRTFYLQPPSLNE